MSVEQETPRNGPDQILPAGSIWTTEADGPVKIRDEDSLTELPPISVPSMLRKAANEQPDKLALAVKREGDWHKWTWKQYVRDSETVAKAFISLGLESFHSVGILGCNSPEWVIAQNAAIMAQGFSVGIYATSNADAVKYIAQNSRANILVAENEMQVKKILEIREELPDLKKIVQYLGTPTNKDVMGWEELLQIGSKQDDEALNERIAKIAINQCCMVLYTSGTTGKPKGVMFSHDNVTWNAYVAGKHMGFGPDEIYLSFLPLSHSAAQMGEVWAPVCFQGTTYFADANALKGTLVQNLKEVRPTFLFGVPRVYEKIQEKMMEIGKAASTPKQIIASWAKRTGLSHHKRKIQAGNSGEQRDLAFTVSRFLVQNKVKAALGLDRCKTIGCGGAPLSIETQEYFLSLDIVIDVTYGMTETMAPHIGNNRNHFKLGSIGVPISKGSVKIDSPDSEGCGEILMSGRNIMMGYLFDETRTKETLTEDGWVRSGDIGSESEGGFIDIKGRIKELIITTGGENIPPVIIEDTIKKELPCLSNVMVVGDKKKFLSCLLTFKTEIEEATLLPNFQLNPSSLSWCQDLGSKATSVQEAAMDDLVKNEIQAGIERANQKAASHAQTIKKWTVIPQDFSIPGGELGPTMKIMRPIVLKKYTAEVEKLYKN